MIYLDVECYYDIVSIVNKIIYPVINTILNKMITEKDLKIISHLRNNARKKVTDISKQMDVPATTIYDRIRTHEKNGLVRKHISLIDFNKLGYSSCALVLFQTMRDSKNRLQSYLQNHENVNSLYRLDFGYHFLAEMVFENLSNLQEFVDHTEVEFNLESIKVFNISQELKKEEFLGKI